MVYLILNIVSIAIFAQFYKVVFHFHRNPISVNLVMTATAFIVYGTLWALSGFPVNATVLGAGLFAGLAFYLAVRTFFRAIPYGPLSVSWSIISMAVIVPTVASILIWHEIPSSLQALGMLLVGVALVLCLKFNMKGEHALKTWTPLVLASCLFSGLVATSSKFLIEQQLEPYKLFYLAVVFFVPTAALSILSASTKSRPKMPELLIGVGMGTFSLCTFIFDILALNALPGKIVFPVRAGGTLFLTSTLSLLIWREKISRRQKLAIVAALLAIVLISMK